MLKINTTKTAMQMRNLFYNSKRNITFDVRDEDGQLEAHVTGTDGSLTTSLHGQSGGADNPRRPDP